jgi:hypothetical protein
MYISWRQTRLWSIIVTIFTTHHDSIISRDSKDWAASCILIYFGAYSKELHPFILSFSYISPNLHRTQTWYR